MVLTSFDFVLLVTRVVDGQEKKKEQKKTGSRVQYSSLCVGVKVHSIYIISSSL